MRVNRIIHDEHLLQRLRARWLDTVDMGPNDEEVLLGRMMALVDEWRECGRQIQSWSELPDALGGEPLAPGMEDTLATIVAEHQARRSEIEVDIEALFSTYCSRYQDPA